MRKSPDSSSNSLNKMARAFQHAFLAFTASAVQLPSTDQGTTNCLKNPDWSGVYNGTFDKIQVTTSIMAVGDGSYDFIVTPVRGLYSETAIPTGDVMSGVCHPPGWNPKHHHHAHSSTVLVCDAKLPGSFINVQGNKTAHQCDEQNQVTISDWYTFSSNPNATVNNMTVNDTGINMRLY